MIYFSQCIPPPPLSPGNFAVEVNGGQFYRCKCGGFFSLSQKRRTVDCIGEYIMLLCLLLLVTAVIFVDY